MAFQNQQETDAEAATDLDRLLRIPGMLMVGAAGRDCGSIRLACAIVERLAARHSIIGVKVTTVHEDGGSCPDRSEDCGPSLAGPYSLVEHRGRLADQGAERLLESGAHPVYRLCVRLRHLGAGARALAERLGPGASTVCLSSSLRRVVEPGLFVIAQCPDCQEVRPSSREVWPLADLVVRVDGHVFDPAPEEFALLDGTWMVRRQATAVVLAGGRSTRMGRDKALLPVSGRPMIEHVVSQLRPHFSQILVSADEASKFSFLGLEVIPDRRPDQGPMMGVASALERSRHDLCFVIACDIPSLPLPLMMRLLREARSGADIVVPVTQDSRYEPLFAVYRRRVKPLLDRALERDVRRIVRIYDECDVRTVQLGEDEGPVNVNTMADYERLTREG